MSSSRSMRHTLLVMLTAALFLTSCNVGATAVPTLDVNAMNTAIVGTTVAQLSVQFTQTAQALPTNTAAPTNTPASVSTAAASTLSGTAGVATIPTLSFVSTPAAGITSVALPTSQGPATAALGDACHNSAYVADITVPDGATLRPGDDVQKIWEIKNTGDCLWDDGYALVQFAGSPELGNKMFFEITRNVEFVSAGQVSQMGIWLDVPCAPGKYEAHFKMQDDGGIWFGEPLSVYFEVKEKCP